MSDLAGVEGFTPGKSPEEQYPMVLFWSEEDGGYIMIAPDFPGLSVFGDTMSQACLEMQAVLPVAIEAITAAGNPVPTPSASSKFILSNDSRPLCSFCGGSGKDRAREALRPALDKTDG